MRSVLLFHWTPLVWWKRLRNIVADESRNYPWDHSPVRISHIVNLRGGFKIVCWTKITCRAKKRGQGGCGRQDGVICVLGPLHTNPWNYGRLGICTPPPTKTDWRSNHKLHGRNQGQDSHRHNHHCIAKEPTPCYWALREHGNMWPWGDGLEWPFFFPAFCDPGLNAQTYPQNLRA